MSKAEELKPCPFCGGEGRMVRSRDIAQMWYCECSHCYTRQMVFGNGSQEEAARRWNARSENNPLQKSLN